MRARVRRYGISPTTVRTWRRRESVADRPIGQAEPRSTVLALEREAMIVAFRRHALLPRDDCCCARQPSVPGPTRLSVHGCLPRHGLARHGLARLPDPEGDRPSKQRVKLARSALSPWSEPWSAIGPRTVASAEVRPGEGRRSLFVARDGTSRVAAAGLCGEAAPPTACRLLQEGLMVVSCRLHTILTDQAIEGALDPKRDGEGPAVRRAAPHLRHHPIAHEPL